VDVCVDLSIPCRFFRDRQAVNAPNTKDFTVSGTDKWEEEDVDEASGGGGVVGDDMDGDGSWIGIVDVVLVLLLLRLLLLLLLLLQLLLLLLLRVRCVIGVTMCIICTVECCCAPPSFTTEL